MKKKEEKKDLVMLHALLLDLYSLACTFRKLNINIKIKKKEVIKIYMYSQGHPSWRATGDFKKWQSVKFLIFGFVVSPRAVPNVRDCSLNPSP